jgi:EmrB/QacA subfamily drug resistance transporter
MTTLRTPSALARLRRGPATASSPLRLGFAAIVLAMLPAVLDQTILATALPTIAGDLGRLSDVSWVIAAYVIAAAASTPMWGKLGDRHGRARLLQLSLVLFLVASAVCGLAQDVTWLIVSRAAQGVAAGGLMTLAMAAVGDLVSPRERGRYQGYIAATFAVATIVGPLLGGTLVQHVGWRYVFYVNLPLGAAALIGLRSALPAPVLERPASPLDVWGAALLAGATAAVMLVCVWGGTRYAWTSATIVALIASGALLALGLVVRERRVADPIVPLHLLRSRAVAVSSGALFLTTAALFSVTVFVPLYLQATTGATPTQAGLLLVPMMLGITVSTNLTGRAIARTGRYKRYPLFGLALMAGALILLAAAAPHPSQSLTGVGLALFGLGFGMVGQVLITAVQNSVEPRSLGIAMATTSFFRGLGGAIGAAVFGAVFVARSGLGGSAGGGAAGAGGGRGGAVASLGAAGRADIIHGVQTVFLAAAPVALVAFGIVLLLREVPLRGAAESPEPAGGSDRAPRLNVSEVWRRDAA